MEGKSQDWTQFPTGEDVLARENMDLHIKIDNLNARIAELEKMKSQIAESLEKMVCTEGEDAGVFFLSPESESKYDPKLNCHVYKHEHFSELGDALIGLWKIVSSETTGKGN